MAEPAPKKRRIDELSDHSGAEMEPVSPTQCDLSVTDTIAPVSPNQCDLSVAETVTPGGGKANLFEFYKMSPNLFDLFNIPTVRSRLMHYLTTKAVLDLCCANPNFKWDLKENEWDVNKRLERFFTNPQAFRSELGKHDAIIGGNFALQFFERVVWPNTELQVFVEKGPKAEAMATFLQDKEGYAKNGSRSESIYRDGEEDDIESPKCYKYTKNSSTYGSQAVELVHAEHTALRTFLVRALSAHVMNFITWNKAYSLFPRPTFLHHEAVAMRQLEKDMYDDGSLLSEFSLRGWRLRLSHPYNRDYQQDGLDMQRRVGDRYTWIMRLDTAGVVQPELPHCAMEYSCFRTKAEDDFGSKYVPRTIACRVYAAVFSSNSLRHKYTWTSGSLWSRFAGFLSHSTMDQLVKLEPSVFRRIVNKYLSQVWDEIFEVEARAVRRVEKAKFSKPASWDFYDDQIPEIWKKIEQGDKGPNAVKNHYFVRARGDGSDSDDSVSSVFPSDGDD